MPLVHFGDTSYERYIFGGKSLPPTVDVKKTIVTNDFSEEIDDKRNYRDEVDGRNSPDRQFQINDLCGETNSDMTVVDGTMRNNRGTHTTTVNLTVTNDEDNGINKIIEG